MARGVVACFFDGMVEVCEGCGLVSFEEFDCVEEGVAEGVAVLAAHFTWAIVVATWV